MPLTEMEEKEQRDKVNESFAAAARGPRVVAFRVAYMALLTMDPSNADDRQIVEKITRSNDPATALLEWFADGAKCSLGKLSLARQS
jgi:hypothetical protein